MSATPTRPLPDPLPLFPLQTVLFPGALLGLKVFEARYLDLVVGCLRSGQPFGVVCLRQGAEAGRGKPPVQLEAWACWRTSTRSTPNSPASCTCAASAGSASGSAGEPTQREQRPVAGRRRADRRRPAAPARPGRAAHGGAPWPRPSASCSRRTAAVRRSPTGWTTPAGWPTAGANCCRSRWPRKQKLMELDDPVIRLSLVDGFLRDKKVVRRLNRLSPARLRAGGAPAPAGRAPVPPRA